MAAKFEPPPRGYYRTHRAAVEALKRGGISIGAFALYNVLTYLGWREGRVAEPTTEWLLYLNVPLHVIELWLAELERSGLVARDGDGWMLVEALRQRDQKQSPLDRSAGAVSGLRADTQDSPTP